MTTQYSKSFTWPLPYKVREDPDTRVRLREEAASSELEVTSKIALGLEKKKEKKTEKKCNP